MPPDPSPAARNARPPIAACRLCSVTCSIDATSPDDLRRRLREFMARHRHDGAADIVIDICTDEAEPDPVGTGAPVTSAALSGPVSPS